MEDKQLKKSRIKWIDVAKGLGIILVVLGHSGNKFSGHYFFWFHMPLFFILNGYTFNDIDTLDDFKMFIKKRMNRLLIPYVSFGASLYIIYTLAKIAHKEFSFSDSINDLLRLIYGGQYLTGFFAVFWFITCLFITQILFALILLFFKSTKMQVLIILAFYLVSHMESHYMHNFSVPFNADVSLIALTYLSFGFYMKKFTRDIWKNVYFSTSVICLSIIFFLCDYLGIYSFTLDMKYRMYTNVAMDLLVPIVISLLVILISYFISKTPLSNLFTSLGLASLSIMYLHFPMNLIVISIFHSYGWIVFSLIGIILPLIFHQIADRFNLLKFLFLGKH